MHDKTHTTRLRFGVASLVALVALAAMAVFAGSAAAGVGFAPRVGFDPQDTNVPYLAWRGQEVRLVKCAAPAAVGTTGAAATGTFVIEDWSGDPFQRPQFENNVGGNATAVPFAGTGEQAGMVCWSQSLVSQKAGIAIVKLTVPGGPGAEPALKHQFIVAWMQIASANVEDIGSTTVNAASAAAVLNATVASAATTGAAANQVQMTVTGSIPMGGNFDEVNQQLGRAAGTPLIMPRDWAAWAGVMARSSIGANERNPRLWDIHDEFTGVPGGGVAPPAHSPLSAGPGVTHQTGGECSGSSTTTDEVDNCLGGPEFGRFSRYIYPFAAGTPDMTFPFTLGPFDPLRPNTSYLPNGVLDQGDAPMPSLRVDFRISAGGVGMLVPIDKHVVYSRNGAGDTLLIDPDGTGPLPPAPDYPGNAHNLWAPFYISLLPATALPAALSTTSGVEGATVNNNYHAFLDGPAYHYWDFSVALSRTGAFVNCPPFAAGPTGTGIRAQEPSGVSEVTVYTDEHGEARVGFAPGTGFFFNALPIVRNANGGCDIQGVNPLGTAIISAHARYPFQPVTVADVPGDEVVTKTVLSRFNKEITCAVKGPGPFNAVAYICTATAIGIDGRPFVGERICFMTNAEGIVPFSGPPVPDPRVGMNRLCLLTNSSGQAAVEIFGKGTLNVIADFVDEGLLRYIQLAGVPLAPGTQGAGGVAPAAGTTTTSTTTPTTAEVISLGGNVTPSTPAAPAAKPAVQRSSLSFARLVETRAGRKVVVRVNGTAATAKIKVVMRAGTKVVGTAVRTVRTNRSVQVPNLRITKKVTRISVSVLS